MWAEFKWFPHWWHGQTTSSISTFLHAQHHSLPPTPLQLWCRKAKLALKAKLPSATVPSEPLECISPFPLFTPDCTRLWDTIYGSSRGEDASSAWAVHQKTFVLCLDLPKAQHQGFTALSQHSNGWIPFISDGNFHGPLPGSLCATEFPTSFRENCIVLFPIPSNILPKIQL